MTWTGTHLGYCSVATPPCQSTFSGVVFRWHLFRSKPPDASMVRSTTIFRVSDALPLAASVDDESVSELGQCKILSSPLMELSRRRKPLPNTNSNPSWSSAVLTPIVNPHAPSSQDNTPCSTLLSPSYPNPFLFRLPTKLRTSGIYSYLIVEKVIYMCICDASYPRKLAFSYLDELSKEFQRSYEGKIETVTRPYAFMGFGE